jgi:hypothetical protein
MREVAPPPLIAPSPWNVLFIPLFSSVIGRGGGGIGAAMHLFPTADTAFVVIDGTIELMIHSCAASPLRHV